MAYVVRKRAEVSQLLVFEHVDTSDAGVQIPAGTVDRGEKPRKRLSGMKRHARKSASSSGTIWPYSDNPGRSSGAALSR